MGTVRQEAGPNSSLADSSATFADDPQYAVQRKRLGWLLLSKPATLVLHIRFEVSTRS